MLNKVMNETKPIWVLLVFAAFINIKAVVFILLAMVVVTPIAIVWCALDMAYDAIKAQYEKD